MTTPQVGRSIAVLIVAEMAAMSLWFVSAAILPEMTAEAGLSSSRAAALSTAVQIGFFFGAVALSVHGTADIYDPRRVFALAAILAAACNAALLFTPVGGNIQILLRGLTGVCLAGVYPVGMKIAVGWSLAQRGTLVGLVVGALTLGTAAPYVLALSGGADWRFTVAAASAAAFGAAIMIGFTKLGPHHARASKFDPAALSLAWRLRPVRLAYAGYLCHMWELYAFWAWVAVAVALSFEPNLGEEASVTAARVLAAVSIVLGALLCVPAGRLADRIGKARIAGFCMIASAFAAFGTAASFGGDPWITVIFVLIWGAFVIPDSAQFSALVADAAPPERVGSLMTLQTALGFLLTAVSVQGAPVVAAQLGWPVTLVILGIGPMLGVEAMRRLDQFQEKGACS